MMSTKESRSDSLTARHCMNELPMLSDDTNVWISSQGEPGQGRVVSSADTLRSYMLLIPPLDNCVGTVTI